ncbi:CRISPR-associated protein, Cas2 family [Thermoclostridium stercorarium subsp. stercorarium DSM 8532]|jgi:CRISPR-associated protein Cas2|uniref:CRISPR-associated endoribonuclease Cas2 n=3 Tax=Thermoclostridium stercorarium TaxID=1510 RepID=L7VPP3_THES1|nr:CRISPR-associated endonuclease Cas2 [Thermoclostridium stercorarium]AGC68634.1 CRISPR-associated protein, Cas2 family [Thermoclostridium stercorarium subsp. stercorarium DSM 8532]AGI39646.1 CRISPR protein [Thermoclostridium stercorarium subsp. stercorarium DSM 8532]ANW98977.1 CRISPR-associated endonuclease Cas2 [Thermoclostridium stercorarium subsp. thermolacticum DSM 2910]ANX01504.1 CRISPR-associated endonuclease Cas2 [Thermoclostridium stercorarium subsp. leptospartum DSM 9219]UZQ84618.1 
MYIILVYDIVLDETGPSVLRKVFKECKKYLVHVQNSVFEGELSESQLFKLEMSLKKLLRKDKDSLIVFKTRNEKWLDKEFWGKEDNATSNFL